MRIADPYIDAGSFLNRLPAALKFSALISVVIVAVALPRTYWLGYAVLLAVLLCVLVISRLPIWTIARRLLLLEPFVLVAAVLSLMQPGGSIVFLSLVLKGSISLLAMVLLVASTRFLDLLVVFRQMHLPGVLITNIALMYRYLFLLLVESERMSRARSSREFTHNKWRVWHGNTTVIGHLFVRTSRRAERIYAAMCARGWRT